MGVGVGVGVGMSVILADSAAVYSHDVPSHSSAWIVPVLNPLSHA